MSVTRDEFLSMIVFATYIAKIDGNLLGSEKNLLKKFAQQACLTEEEISSAKNNNSLEIMIQKLQSNQSKELLVNILYLVASSDGEFDRDENAFIIKVIHRLGLKENSFPYFEPGGNPDRKEIEENTMQQISNLSD